MTAPRQILRGTTYLITRRCALRRFFLRPSPALNELILYVVALAASRMPVQVHAFCFMSNHFHVAATDPDARLPEFMRYVGSLIARAGNRLLGRGESFWAPGSYNAVVLADPQTVVEKIAYTLANPVAAGLVRSASEWPGLWTAPQQLAGTKLTARKPETFFRNEGDLPDTVELELTLPPGFDDAEEFRRVVADALADRERQARRARETAGSGFLGAAQVLAQDPSAGPESSEPRGGLKPRVAARDRPGLRAALARLVEFLTAYRVAWIARRDGESGVVFPAGTYLLRVAHGVPCAASP